MKREEIKDLMKFFDEMNINRIRIKEDDFELELEKYEKVPEFTPEMCPTQAPQQPINLVVNNEKVTTTPQSSKDTINSPMVGTFYFAPSPGAAPFVKAGQTIKKGSTIGIIEAMKIMNEIEAEFDCRITEALISDGQPVEFDMPLFTVEKI